MNMDLQKSQAELIKIVCLL